ncbi:viral A-type inclusion protein [Reticulomyxa filosa]|uniref:Viral A-type inclusion protein n=1 Tax=Reticulomyxa filosa TaxID=46433 RepID=X6NMT2_RETFI|nr:viral A-type inclusion protein [Reticulomyxa filosa]|eukprot:ETO27243.1 viral A-type inclusion protein [Reticulomyxa filosa]
MLLCFSKKNLLKFLEYFWKFFKANWLFHIKNFCNYQTVDYQFELFFGFYCSIVNSKQRHTYFFIIQKLISLALIYQLSLKKNMLSLQDDIANILDLQTQNQFLHNQKSNENEPTTSTSHSNIKGKDYKERIKQLRSQKEKDKENESKLKFQKPNESLDQEVINSKNYNSKANINEKLEVPKKFENSINSDITQQNPKKTEDASKNEGKDNLSSDESSDENIFVMNKKMMKKDEKKDDTISSNENGTKNKALETTTAIPLNPQETNLAKTIEETIVGKAINASTTTEEKKLAESVVKEPVMALFPTTSKPNVDVIVDPLPPPPIILNQTCLANFFYMTGPQINSTTDISSQLLRNVQEELAQARQLCNKLMNEKSQLLEEIESLNQKTERLLNDQRTRLQSAHKLEINRLQNELSEARNNSNKMKSQHQSELLVLEEKLRKESSEMHTSKINEITRMEQRYRDELNHALSIHEAAVQSLQQQHKNELESVEKLHHKQLTSLREQLTSNVNVTNLLEQINQYNQTINTLTQDLEKMKNHYEHDKNENLAQQKLLIQKYNSQIVELQAQNKALVEQFQLSLDQTKYEKGKLAENEAKLREKENKLLEQLNNNNRDLCNQRELLAEERKQFENKVARWEQTYNSQKNEIERLSIQHKQRIESDWKELQMEKEKLKDELLWIEKDKFEYEKEKEKVNIMKNEIQQSQIHVEKQWQLLESEKQTFEHRVKDVSNLSHKVHEQSEKLTIMYDEIKKSETHNIILEQTIYSNKNELQEQFKSLKCDQQRIQHDRKLLEKEQLDLLLTKKQLLQQLVQFTLHLFLILVY